MLRKHLAPLTHKSIDKDVACIKYLTPSVAITDNALLRERARDEGRD